MKGKQAMKEKNRNTTKRRMLTSSKSAVRLIRLDGYTDFVASLKSRVRMARVGAALAVNRQLVMLYWDIGKSICHQQQTAGWGDAVVERIAADLRAAFPGMSGFSNQNVWRMKQLYVEYTAPEFLSQAVREIKLTPRAKRNPEFLSQAVREMVTSVSWGHHFHLLAKVSDPLARWFYLRSAGHFGWSRNVLINQIKAHAYERTHKEKKATNFALALPEQFAERAEEMLKSRYSLEFLGVAAAISERELEDRLVSNLQRFILELGYGFCFVGRQYRLALGRKEYFVDLLFYHRFLKTLVAFDLKVGSFEPEHAGKMDFYLNLLNERERGPDDQPSIGIILCAEKADIEVEYALKTKNNPIGVAEYQLQTQLPAKLKGKLPTAQQLAEVVRNALPNLKRSLTRRRS